MTAAGQHLAKRRPGPQAPTSHERAVVAAAAPAATPAHDLDPDPAGQNPYVSIILPCHNEEGHVVTEVTRICAAMDASGYDYELTAYDDASTDQTLARLQDAAPQFPHLKIVAFRRNGGSGRSGGSAPRTPGARSWSGPTPT
jgi:hypothetical protein